MMSLGFGIFKIESTNENFIIKYVYAIYNRKNEQFILNFPWMGNGNTFQTSFPFGFSNRMVHCLPSTITLLNLTNGVLAAANSFLSIST